MGGKGSGRKPTADTLIRKNNQQGTPIGYANEGIYLPNYSGIKKEALKSDPTELGGGSSVSDEAYGGSWNGDTTTAASKNAIYDKIETLAGGHDAVTLAGTGTYLSLTSQEITVDPIDISDDTNLTAGTGITLTGDTLSTNDSEIDHTSIANKGTNTHAQIDTHIEDTSGDPHSIADSTLTFTNKTIDADGTGNSITNIDNANIKAGAAIDMSKTAFVAGTNCTLSTNTLNVDDAFIKNDGDDTSSGKITAANFAVTGDNNTNDSEYVPMVLHGTDATPPTASGFPRGTIYIQYTE
jgi:hypothetical protein